MRSKVRVSSSYGWMVVCRDWAVTIESDGTPKNTNADKVSTRFTLIVRNLELIVIQATEDHVP